MSDVVIRVENLSKEYRLGTIGSNTLRADASRWWAKWRGQPDPTLKVGQIDHSDRNGERIWALQDVNFEVKQGEVLGIIGRNGAGKSTLLKILSRVTVPTSGDVKIKGRIASLLEVGTGFHPELTGRENIYLNGAILGMRKHEIDCKFDEIVDFSGVDKYIDTPVKRYSSGMYVRLAFAVAAHLEPEILVIDEVLAVGDAEFQKKCLGKMGDVADAGRTVLFVSHNMVAMQSLCEQVIWVNQGKLVKQGQPSQIISNYLQASSANTASMKQAWDDPNTAPGNDIVRLRCICVRQNDNSDVLTMETPFVIEIDYENLVPRACLHITLHFYTEQGIVAFTTGSALDPLWQTQQLAVGLYRSSCHVPANLLNSGRHHVLLLVVKDRSSVIFRQPEIVSFDVIDVAERQGTWYGKEPGVVQPLLQWTTERLTSMVNEIDGTANSSAHLVDTAKDPV